MAVSPDFNKDFNNDFLIQDYEAVGQGSVVLTGEAHGIHGAQGDAVAIISLQAFAEAETFQAPTADGVGMVLLTAEAHGIYEASEQPEVPTEEPKPLDTRTGTSFEPIVWKKLRTGRGEGFILLSAQAHGEHFHAVEGHGKACILLKAKGAGEHVDSVGNNNAFVMLFAA